jgi:hypothetical protein
MKGGKLIKITNPSTRIKLEVIPDTEDGIDSIKQSELYLTKQPKKINMILQNMPDGLKKYNREYIESLPEENRKKVLDTIKVNLEYNGFDTNGVDILSLLEAKDSISNLARKITKRKKYINSDGEEHEFIYGEDGEVIAMDQVNAVTNTNYNAKISNPISTVNQSVSKKDTPEPEPELNKKLNNVFDIIKNNMIISIIILICIILLIAGIYIYFSIKSGDAKN